MTNTQTDKQVNEFEYTPFSTWMLGGQSDPMGGHTEGFNTFDEYLDSIESEDDIRDAISNLLEEGEKYTYYDEVFDYTEIEVPGWAIDKLVEEISDKIKASVDESLIYKDEEIYCACKPSPGSNQWSQFLLIDFETKEVEVSERHGNGISERAYNGFAKEISLPSYCDKSQVDDLIKNTKEWIKNFPEPEYSPHHQKPSWSEDECAEIDEIVGNIALEIEELSEIKYNGYLDVFYAI